MLKNFAMIFGIVLIVIGILGFFPTLTPEGYLLGLFHVNTAHNLVHLLSGIVALLCSLNGFYASQLFFQVFGVIYGLVALFGLYYQDQPIFGLIANNLHDIWLHILISAVSLYLGFIYHDKDLISR